MPRRYFNYSDQYQSLHVWSTIGTYILLVAFLLIAYYLIDSLVRGAKAPANPWGGASMEWQTSSPPPVENFLKEPVVGDPYDFTDLVFDREVGGYVKTTKAGAA